MACPAYFDVTSNGAVQGHFFTIFFEPQSVHAEKRYFELNSPFYSCVPSDMALSGGEAGVDLVLIQTLLLFICKCKLVSMTTATT